MATRKTLVGSVDAEILKFTVGKDPTLDLVLAEPDCIGTAAHVTMLAQLPITPPILSNSDAEAVVSALIDIIRSVRTGKFRIGERDQDVHLAIEQRLTRVLGDLGRRIHTGRSRNDQVALDLRLFAKQQLLDLMEETVSLADALCSFARRHANVPMVGRTHLQPAMPSSVGLWASAYTESLLDDLYLLTAVYDLNDRSPLGSAAGFGVPLPIDRALTARLLGLRGPIHNVLHASNARGKCESAILGALSQVMLTISRLAEDLILYTMPEFGYFSLPETHCTGSSIMPQKRNPDVPELIRAKAAKVQGCASTATAIVAGLPGGYNRDLQETKEPFMEGLSETRACVRVLQPLVRGLKANREALKAGFRPDVFATDRALELVAGGTPFRTAYADVKSGLDKLEGMDPVAAIAAKTHEGAPGGLDFASLTTRAVSVKKLVKKERRRYYSAISGLLGIRYPALER